MKNNTENAKELLQKALSQTPQDNSLSEVRYHIRAALGKLEHVEKKRNRREINAKHREEVKISTTSSNRIIQVIDEMIAAEIDKLTEIKQRKKKTEDDEFQLIGE